MRKTFPLGLLEELGITGEPSTPPRRRRTVKAAAKQRAHAEEAFDRLAKSLQPAHDGLDSDWD
jgi:hypothetical protein